MAREMKDSGVEWIGEIPREWEILPLGNCFLERVEKVSDREWEPLSVTKKGIFKQLENVAKSDAHDSRKKVCKGDFVINSRSDRKQSCGLSDFDGSVSLINIVLKNIFYNKEYTKYLLKNDGFAEEFYRWGSGIVADLWSTKYSKMKKIILPVPPLEEQEKIANYLDKKVSDIDLIIEKTKATIEDYKKYKQSIITEAVTKGINPNVEMKDSGIEWIGEIPKEWEVKRIKYIFYESGERTKTGEEEPLSMSQKYGLIPTKLMENIPNLASSFVNCKIVYKNDLVFNKLKAHLGVFSKSNYYGLVSPDYAVYKAKTKININYFEALFKTKKYISEFIKFSRGVGQGLTRLYTEEFFNIFAIFPPLEEQNQIAEYLDKKTSEIDTLIIKKEALITELEEYKKSLIYECVTGKKEANENV